MMGFVLFSVKLQQAEGKAEVANNNIFLLYYGIS